MMRTKSPPIVNKTSLIHSPKAASGSQALKKMLLDHLPGGRNKTLKQGGTTMPDSNSPSGETNKKLSPCGKDKKHSLETSPSRYSLRSNHLLLKSETGKRLSKYKRTLENSRAEEKKTNSKAREVSVRKQKATTGTLTSKPEEVVCKSALKESLTTENKSYPSKDVQTIQKVPPKNLVELLKAKTEVAKAADSPEIKQALSSKIDLKSFKMRKEDFSPAELSDSLTSLDFNRIIPMQPLDIDDIEGTIKIEPILNFVKPLPATTYEKENRPGSPKDMTQTGDPLEEKEEAFEVKESETPPNTRSASECLDPTEPKTDWPTKDLSDSLEIPPNYESKSQILDHNTGCIGDVPFDVVSQPPKTEDQVLSTDDNIGHCEVTSESSKLELNPLDMTMNKKPLVIEPEVQESVQSTSLQVQKARNILCNQLKQGLMQRHVKRNRVLNKRFSCQNRLFFTKRNPMPKPATTAISAASQQKLGTGILRQNLLKSKPKVSATVGRFADVVIFQTPPLVIPVVNKKLIFQEISTFNQGSTYSPPARSFLPTPHHTGQRVKSILKNQLLQHMQEKKSIDEQEDLSCESSPDGSFNETHRLHTCGICHMGFTVESDWLRHQKQQCSERTDENSLLYFCNRCPASFQRHRDWVAHRKTHSITTPRWQCDRCSFIFSSRRDLRDHRFQCASVSEDPAPDGPEKTLTKFKCKVCHKAFPYPSALRVHQETHILKHKCPVCSETFTRFYEMTKHVRNVHPEVSSHACEHCGKVFDRLTILYRHKADGLCISYQAPKGRTS